MSKALIDSILNMFKTTSSESHDEEAYRRFKMHCYIHDECGNPNDYVGDLLRTAYLYQDGAQIPMWIRASGEKVITIKLQALLYVLHKLEVRPKV